MRRIFLFLCTNLAVVVVLSLITSVLGLGSWMTSRGIDYTALLGFCFVFGAGGAFLSLLMSKPVAKWTMGARVITLTDGPREQFLVKTVAKLAARADIGMPEVAIYPGAPNAFATGFSRNNALVAVSSGLLESMPDSEIEAVLAHEVAHVASGDMVTLTLIQGVVNTFVMFIARIVGYFVDQVILHQDEEEKPSGWGYTLTVIVLDLLLGIGASLIVAAFSRRREFAADAQAVTIMHGDATPMIKALQSLARGDENSLPSQLKTFGISGGGALLGLFASHPPLSDRITALRELKYVQR